MAKRVVKKAAKSRSHKSVAEKSKTKKVKVRKPIETSAFQLPQVLIAATTKIKRLIRRQQIQFNKLF
jgi:hypothetical protein